MRRIALGAALALAACGQADTGGEALKAFDVDEPAPPPKPAGAAMGAQPLAVSVPRIAYTYDFSFVLPADALAGAQAAHVALCDRMGLARCQLLEMQTRRGGDTADAASLKLRVASAEARRFGAAAIASVGKVGGRAVDQQIAAEDVSKQMVDAAARIRQRELLVTRLTEILRTRTGKVAELVEAERSVATAQEELDAARGWLAELSGRVAYSTVQIDYRALTAASDLPFGGRLLEDVQVSFATFAAGLRQLIGIAILLAPWALLVGLATWAVRRWRKRRPPSSGAG